MNKAQLKTFAEYFGTGMNVSKIADKDVRMQMIMLYGSIAKAYKPVADEIEEIRKKLTTGHETELQEYAELCNPDPNLTPEENSERFKKAQSMEECVRIDSDFREAAEKIYSEEVKDEIKAVSLATLYEALMDCGFPRIGEDATLSAISNTFGPIIKD